MKKVNCPICGTWVDVNLFTRSSAVDQQLLAQVERSHPGWQASDGLCPGCVQEALDHFRATGADLHDLIYRAELAADDPGLLVEPTALPIAVRVPNNPRFTGRGVCIAFLDAGFYPHPDLTTPVNRIKAFVNAGVDPVDENADINDPALYHAHGMMTTVVAAGNGSLSNERYRGLAPDAELVLVRVADAEGHIGEDSIMRGLAWVLANRERLGINMVNISVSGDSAEWTWQNPLDRMVDRAVAEGLLVVVAAGNSPDAPILSPASAPMALTVGGVNDYNTLNPDELALWHSTSGPTLAGHIKPEILAPSIWLAAPIPPWLEEAQEADRFCSVISLPDQRIAAAAAELGFAPDGEELQPEALKGGLIDYMASKGWVSADYKYVDGTSFAAPIVISVAAQMKQANPLLDAIMLKGLLVETAEALPDVDITRQGAGVMQAGKAVAAAMRSFGGLLDQLPFSPKVSGSTITFVHYAPEARNVAVTADFNHWAADKGSMNQVEQGVWCYTSGPLAPGSYRYKFLINGEIWLDDPENGEREPDGYGGVSSVVVVGSAVAETTMRRMVPMLAR